MKSMENELAWRSPYFSSPAYRQSVARPVLVNAELTPDQEAILRLIGPTGKDSKAERKRRILKARLLGIEVMKKRRAR